MGKKKKKLPTQGKGRWLPGEFRKRVVQMRNKPRRKADFNNRRHNVDGYFFIHFQLTERIVYV